MGLRDCLVRIERGCANCSTAVSNGTIWAIGVEYCCFNTEISSIIEDIYIIVVYLL